MLPRRARTLLLAVALVAGLLGPASADPPADQLPPIPAVPGLPIVALSTDATVPAFIGAASTAQRIKQKVLPQNPGLAANGRSSMHNDAYSSDAYQVAGPAGRNLQMTTMSYGVRECATVTFDTQGRIVALCGGLEGFTMMLIDPVTLESLDQLTMSTRDVTSGANPFTDICGGTYFFLDPQNRAFATTTRSSIVEVDVHETPTPGLTAVKEWPLAGSLPEGDCLVATGLSWNGIVWFVSQQGTVGTLNRDTGEVKTLRLGTDEGIFNSISTDETGGMYPVTTKAMYRLDIGADGQPKVTWRRAYGRGSVTKPGMLSQGSGTSPTLIGKRWVAITDNHEPRTRVLFYDRRRRSDGARKKRLHCAVSIFGEGASTTENSLVAVGNSVIAENNYGYSSVQATMGGKTTSPGLARVKLTRKGCKVMWENDTISAPSSVAKASLGSGLIYAYTKPARSDGTDAWYFSAIDIRTGKLAWSKLTGTGIQWNNHYAAIYLGPDGAAYISTLSGLIRLADGPQGSSGM